MTGGWIVEWGDSQKIPHEGVKKNRQLWERGGGGVIKIKLYYFYRSNYNLTLTLTITLTLTNKHV